MVTVQVADAYIRHPLISAHSFCGPGIWTGLVGTACLCPGRLGPQLEGLAAGGDPMARGWDHLEVSSLSGAVDANCWLGPQLGYWPELRHEASPYG